MVCRPESADQTTTAVGSPPRRTLLAQRRGERRIFYASPEKSPCRQSSTPTDQTLSASRPRRCKTYARIGEKTVRAWHERKHRTSRGLQTPHADASTPWTKPMTVPTLCRSCVRRPNTANRNEKWNELTCRTRHARDCNDPQRTCSATRRASSIGSCAVSAPASCSASAI